MANKMRLLPLSATQDRKVLAELRQVIALSDHFRNHAEVKLQLVEFFRRNPVEELGEQTLSAINQLLSSRSPACQAFWCTIIIDVLDDVMEITFVGIQLARFHVDDPNQNFNKTRSLEWIENSANYLLMLEYRPAVREFLLSRQGCALAA